MDDARDMARRLAGIAQKLDVLATLVDGAATSLLMDVKESDRAAVVGKLAVELAMCEQCGEAAEALWAASRRLKHVALAAVREASR